MRAVRRGLGGDERGIEPTVMQILVGIILVTIGLAIGITVYQKFGGAAESYLNYSLTVHPSEGTIRENDSDTAMVSVETPTGYNKVVALSASGVPEKVSVLFNEQSSYSDKVPYHATMKVVARSGAPAGIWTITIRGNSEDGVKTTSYELTIE